MIVKWLRGGWVRRLAAPGAAFLTLLVTSGALPAQPVISKSFSPNSVQVGQTSTLTFTINNPSGSDITGVAFTDTFPPNLFVQNPNSLTGGCGAGVISAPGGGNSVSLSGGTIPAGGSCIFSVAVLVLHQATNTTTMYVNTTGNVTASSGTGNTASDTLSGVSGTFSTAKGFSPNAINQGSNSTLIFTITAAQANTAPPFSDQIKDIVFSDTLPAGVVVATPPNVQGGTCTALATNPSLVVMATAGSSTI